METIYGVDRGHTLKNLYNSNNLYQATVIWSDCNTCSKSAMKSAARSFPWSTWAFGSELPSPVISFPGIYSTTLHWQYRERKKLTYLLKNFRSSSTPRNWNLPFFLVLLVILHCKLINYVMLLYKCFWVFLLRVPLFTNICINTSNV